MGGKGGDGGAWLGVCAGGVWGDWAREYGGGVEGLRVGRGGRGRNCSGMGCCLGGGLELLSAPAVLAVCRGSGVLRVRWLPLSVTVAPSGSVG